MTVTYPFKAIFDKEISVSDISTQEAKRIARKAYIFGFPFVANYRVFIHPLISGHPLMQGADFNQFAHNRQLFPPTTAHTTQRDTLFSLGILDLRREPVVISVSDVPEGQVYMLQLGDTSTECLPYIKQPDDWRQSRSLLPGRP
jgi:hypothetical protein